MKQHVLFLIAILLVIPHLHGQENNFVEENYIKTEYQVEMRDGVKLFTIVYTPKDKSDKYPFLMR